MRPRRQVCYSGWTSHARMRKREKKGLHPCAYQSEENLAIKYVLKEKGISHENYKQHAASGMPEKYS
ncbi:hypothetical protein QL285_070824 [Trifolium repens]|nr:hypothetical protein QL285_070824 [Trifolium repens]